MTGILEAGWMRCGRLVSIGRHCMLDSSSLPSLLRKLVFGTDEPALLLRRHQSPPASR